MTETVREALGAQRAFVADASHQLRNPLTALRLRLSNLDGHVDPAAADDHLAAMEEAERLSRVLDGLLALARAERAVEDPGVAEDTDLDVVVAERVDNWRPLAEHSGIELRRSGPRGLHALIGEPALESVLDALLDNALKYTRPGDGCGSRRCAPPTGSGSASSTAAPASHVRTRRAPPTGSGGHPGRPTSRAAGSAWPSRCGPPPRRAGACS